MTYASDMSYGYPELSIQDIVTSFPELIGVPVHEAMFKSPDAQQWMLVFRKMVCSVTDTPEDAFMQQPLLSVDIEYTELHMDSMPMMTLITSIQRVMALIGFPDFHVGDCIAPTTIRLQKICSAVINFMRFKHLRSLVYEGIVLELEKEHDHQEAYLKRNQELKQKINKKVAERTKLEPEVLKAEKAVEESTIRMQELQQNKVQLQKQVTDIKAKCAEVKSETDRLTCETLKLNEDADQLALKIVQSPDKVREEHENRMLQLNDLKEALETKRQRQRNLQQMLNGYKQNGQDAEKGIRLLDTIKKSIDKERELDAVLAQHIDNIHDYREQIQNCSVHQTQVQELLTSRKEKLAKMSLQHQSRMKVIKEQTDALQHERQSATYKQSSDSQRKVALLDYKKDIEESVKKEERLVEEKINEILDEYRQLLDITNNFNGDFSQNWDEIRQILKE